MTDVVVAMREMQWGDDQKPVDERLPFRKGAEALGSRAKG
jgi:hypothetical protein